MLALVAAACSRESGRRPAVAGGDRQDAGVSPAPPPEDILVEVELGPGELDLTAVERTVTTRIEDALARVRALADLRSASTTTRVRVAGRLASGVRGVDAARDVADALRRLAPPLPVVASAPVVSRSLSVERARWLLSSSTWTPLQMVDLRDQMIRPALQPPTGAASAALCGGGEAVVRVVVDVDRASAFGLDLLAIRAALTRSSLASFRSIDDLASAPIGRPGRSVRLVDIATIDRGVTEAPCRAWDGDGRDVLSIQVALDADSGPVEEAARRMRDRVAALAAQLPAEVDVTPFAPAAPLVIELGFEPAGPGIDVAVARQLSAVRGVIGVLVEIGHPFGAADPPEAPDVRAIVAIDRPESAAAVVAAVDRPELGLRVLSGPGAEVRIHLLGSEIEPLHTAAEGVAAALRSVPGVAAAGTSRAAPRPRLDVRPDATRAAAHGWSVEEVARAAHLALHGEVIASLPEGDRAIPVRLELAAPPGAPPAARLQPVQLRAASGAVVPLSSIAVAVVSAEPASILHIDRRRAVEVWFRPASGAALDRVMTDARRAVESAGVPAGIDLAWPAVTPSSVSASPPSGTPREPNAP